MALTVSGMNSGMASTLFAGMGGGNTGLYGMISDYNSIKSGQYGKLLGSYYSQMSGESQSASSSKSSRPVDHTSRGYYQQYLAQQEAKKNQATSSNSSSATVPANDAQKASSKVATAASDMVDSLDTLRGNDLYKKTGSAMSYDREKITSALNDYVDAYNNVIDNASKISSNGNFAGSVSGIASNVSSMQKYTSSYAKQLSEIGVNIGENGKLSIDKDTLANADMSKVKSLFDKGSYGYSVRTNAAMTNYYAKQATSNVSTYGSNGSYSLSDLVSNYQTSI